MDESLAATLGKLEELALSCGFTGTGRLDAATITVHKAVRDACAEDKCNSYGKSWSCPPACGSLEECEKQLKKYRTGLILQTTGKLEDAFDADAMLRISEEHNDHLLAFQEKVVTLSPYGLLLGSGCCKICKQCNYPNSPCNFPGKIIISMEAMGIIVSDICKKNNVPYYYGPNTLTYVGCFLI
jgi:predicted metal-binding protein